GRVAGGPAARQHQPEWGKSAVGFAGERGRLRSAAWQWCPESGAHHADGRRDQEAAELSRAADCLQRGRSFRFQQAAKQHAGRAARLFELVILRLTDSRITVLLLV